MYISAYETSLMAGIDKKRIWVYVVLYPANYNLSSLAAMLFFVFCFFLTDRVTNLSLK